MAEAMAEGGGAAYWLASHGFLSLLSYTSRVAPLTMGWANPHQSLNKKMFFRIAHSMILWRHFPN